MSDADETDAGGESDNWSFPEDLPAVREALISWYEADHRPFPWRETDDPYEILVSEIMSQQTQLGRVVTAWETFLDDWPTPEALAEADRADVVAFWTSHSLGYNNRAKYLHEAAQQVVEGVPTESERGDGEAVEPGGGFPETPEELQNLMGVGPYTANAVASFAFNNGNAVVDTNVKRVLYRAFDFPDDDQAFEEGAAQLMPEGESRVWNNAIMELGGVACEKSPKCDSTGCPWREWCHAYETGDFTAPDVPTQPSFEGSRRQFRGRIISTLKEYDELPLSKLGPRVRVDYAPEGEYGREWLEGLLSDLADDGLVEVEENDAEGDEDGEDDEKGETVARLRR